VAAQSRQSWVSKALMPGMDTLFKPRF